MIDDEGYRANVGIVITNPTDQLFWGRRTGSTIWQFPQGGIDAKEQPIDALYRELYEEVGLQPKDVTVLAETDKWYRYRLPKAYQRADESKPFIGQKQKWYFVKLITESTRINLTVDTPDKQEFDAFQWVAYDYPIAHVVSFKKSVYEHVLAYFSTYRCCQSEG